MNSGLKFFVESQKEELSLCSQGKIPPYSNQPQAVCLLGVTQKNSSQILSYL